MMSEAPSAEAGDFELQLASCWRAARRYYSPLPPHDLHARDRHVRAHGAEEVNEYEEFIRDMEERASMAF